MTILDGRHKILIIDKRVEPGLDRQGAKFGEIHPIFEKIDIVHLEESDSIDNYLVNSNYEYTIILGEHFPEEK